ncbi:MAG TPA: isoprenylcysteine carboxylmethyltransferase family protein [Candidatus Acidoferrum sp.]|jgi:protein-S-isoprenylcysteine O-methyltransferase Ste14|nr:isoprenylcysteine carboxylmethyltransferase family protein [Candidatus Acidoferrum sp.]
MTHEHDPFLQAREFFLDNIFPGRARVRASRRPIARPAFLTKSFVLSFLCATVWFVTAFCGLRQWRSATPWSQLDVFSVTLLALLLVWSVATALFHREMFQSREIMLEASGMNFDKLMFFWIDVFAAAEVLVFFDYGQWHLVPQLREPYLQIPGLALCIAGTVWLIWTDIYLSRQFRGGLSDRRMMNHGPYHFVRHPRYAGLIISSIAFALAMSSVIAWALAIGWIWVNVRRVELEENHLRGLFGAEYDRYAARTARFFPGVY